MPIQNPGFGYGERADQKLIRRLDTRGVSANSLIFLETLHLSTRRERLRQA